MAKKGYGKSSKPCIQSVSLSNGRGGQQRFWSSKPMKNPGKKGK